jgi:hypothetical protein
LSCSYFANFSEFLSVFEPKLQRFVQIWEQKKATAADAAMAKETQEIGRKDS